MSVTEKSPQASFVRGLGLFDSTAMVAGSMIGSGIFIVTAAMARDLGSPGWVLIAWIIPVLLTLMGAACYSELAAMLPKAGGQYAFLREAHGPVVGFLYGWTLFTVIQTGTIAAVSVAFAKFLGILVPEISATAAAMPDATMIAFGRSWHLHLSTQQATAIGAVIFLTLNNSRGIEAGKVVQNVFTTLKVGALLALIAIGLSRGANLAAAWHMDPFWAPIANGVPLSGVALWTTLGTVMVGSLFSLDAWNNLTFATEEVRQPEKTLPRALLLGTLGVGALYLVTNIVYMLVLPFDGIQHAAEDRVATVVMEGAFGAIGAKLMAAAIMVSTFGCANGIIMAGSRVLYAMAKDGLFFAKAGELNQYGVPQNALWMQALWTVVLTLSGSYGDLLDYVIFAALLFYVLTVAGIFVMRRKAPNMPRPIRVWGYPVMPALYMLGCTVIMINLLIYKPTHTWPGLAIVLSGLPVYWFWQRRIGQAT
ncbi:MAG: amino acid permease [Candidatus Sericytochromatia bacterium]|nr:amino acid permease [Candidatus Sericytochromatia bacterium]